MIPVTKPFIPPIEEYTKQVERAFKNEWLTNRGELVLELEKKLATYLSLEESQVLLTNNGTTPLQIALKSLGKQGEIITTPFSYVATTAAIVWEGCTPVFVDIHPDQLTIDETKIEAAITERTTCILATHVFGNPCNVDEIDRIAKKHNLKVIYDGAHAFGVNYKDKSIFEYGDVSTCSFHATKLFHTGEGGALFCNNPDLFDELYYRHNFGHDGQIAFHGLGINGKMSELQAAMGLSILPHMEIILETRKQKTEHYRKKLAAASINFQEILEHTDWNYSYFPVLLKDEKTLLQVQNELNKLEIFPRRYFYPSLHNLPYVDPVEMHISQDIAERILCLPLFLDLDETSIDMICSKFY